MRVLGSLAFAGVLITSVAARADQCQLVESDISDWALKLLVKGASFIHYCEPCGDKAPGATTAITKVEAKKDASGTEISLNGKGVDLAYMFVQTGKTTYTNVATLVGCPVHGVSVSLDTSKKTVAAGGTPPWCKRLVDSYARLDRCDKLPQASRDAMRQALETMKKGWGDLSKADKATLKAIDDGCKAGTDGVEQAIAAVGCQ